MSKLKQWAIEKLFRLLPDDEHELWKWSYTGRVMHESWLMPNFEHQIEKPTEGVYCVPIFSEEYCDWLIKQAEELDEWSVSKKDEYAGWEVNLNRLHHGFVDNYHKEVVILQNLAARVFGGLYGWAPEKVEKCFLIKYEPTEIAEMDSHYDQHSLVSISINLNTEFEGGDLTFIRTPEDRVSQKKGWGAIFAGNPTMRHQAHPITAGVRYVLVYWIK